MRQRLFASVLILVIVSGCAASKPWGQGAILGGLTGAAALGTAGGVIAGNVTPPFTDQDKDRGAGVAIGLFTGAIIGAVVGHVFFDPEVEPEAPPAVAPIEKTKIILRGVRFGFDSAVVPDAARPVLEQAGLLLGENPDVQVEVQGHTDSVGSDAYNLALSRRRAESVRAVLISGGVAASRLLVEGLGKNDPVATNETAVGREQNRRVELVPAD